MLWVSNMTQMIRSTIYTFCFYSLHIQKQKQTQTGTSGPEGTALRHPSVKRSRGENSDDIIILWSIQNGNTRPGAGRGHRRDISAFQTGIKTNFIKTKQTNKSKKVQKKEKRKGRKEKERKTNVLEKER